jgi:hypothetical protein
MWWRRQDDAGHGSFALSWADCPRDLKDTRASHRPSQGGGDEAQRACRAADRPLGERGRKTRGAGEGRSARPCGAQAKLRAAVRLEQLAARCQKVTEQIDRRSRGLKITDRLVSLADPGCAPDPQGQVRQTHGVWVPRADLRGDSEHPTRSPRVHPARRARAGQPSREPAAAPNRARARTCRDHAQGDHRRWRVPAQPHQRRLPRTHRAADPDLRPPRARITQNPQAQSTLPNRYRGTHQPPQARLRATPNETEGR